MRNDFKQKGKRSSIFLTASYLDECFASLYMQTSWIKACFSGKAVIWCLEKEALKKLKGFLQDRASTRICAAEVLVNYYCSHTFAAWIPITAPVFSWVLTFSLGRSRGCQVKYQHRVCSPHSPAAGTLPDGQAGGKTGENWPVSLPANSVLKDSTVKCRTAKRQGAVSYTHLTLPTKVNV